MSTAYLTDRPSDSSLLRAFGRYQGLFVYCDADSDRGWPALAYVDSL